MTQPTVVAHAAHAERRTGRELAHRGLAVVLLVALIALLGATSSAEAASRRGELRVEVTGLPDGTRPAVTVTGPRGYRKQIRRSGRTTLRIRAGAYRVRARSTTVRRTRGYVQRGATASPAIRTQRLRVRAARRADAVVDYGRIVNPRVASGARGVTAVTGDPLRPTAVTIKRPSAAQRRARYLTSGPTDVLPAGLVARVRSTERRGASTTFRVKPASIAEVVPAFDYEQSGEAGLRPLATTGSGRASTGGFGCTISGGPAASPAISVPVVRRRASFRAGRRGARPSIDAEVAVTVRPTLEATLELRAAASCGVSVAVFTIPVAAGGIPGFVSLQAGATVGAEASFPLVKAKVQAERTLGVAVRDNVPARIDVATAPQMSVDVLPQNVPDASLTAGLGVTAKVGIGVESSLAGANVYGSVGSSLDLTWTPAQGTCTLDANIGSFAAGVEVGLLSVESAPFQPLAPIRLATRPCPGKAPAAPASGPAPATQTAAARPSPSTRATLSWDTPTDVDLHVWDEQGNHVWYGDTTGIPGAHLVEDVIPGYGPETFIEDDQAGRRFTYGLCLFSGDEANATLSVSDPDGTGRSATRRLTRDQPAALAAASPSGGGFVPQPGWCGSNDPTTVGG